VLKIIDASPAVQAELLGRDYTVTMGPAPAQQKTGPCAENWCVLVSLRVEGVDDPRGALLVIADLTEQAPADVFWRSSARQERGQ
jgi:hypothetical protein